MSGISKYTHTAGPGNYPSSSPPVLFQPGGNGSNPAPSAAPGPSGPADTPSKAFSGSEAGHQPGPQSGPQGSDASHPLNFFAASQNSAGAKGVQGEPATPDSIESHFGLNSPRW